MLINSLLDTDLYKLTMQQAVYYFFLGKKMPHVKYKFTNRNKDVKFGNMVMGSLQAELNHILELRFTTEDTEYLASIRVDSKPIFFPEYLSYLDRYKSETSLHFWKENDGELYLDFEGPWISSILYEVPFMATISELYSKYVGSFISPNSEVSTRLNAMLSLASKAQLAMHSTVRGYPYTFSDFGTRRRHSFQMHDKIIESCLDKNMRLSGTSNVFFARKHNIQPIGTFAHELPMVMSGVVEDPTEAYREVMDMWMGVYRLTPSLSVMLPDTFTTDWFLKNHGEEWVANWKGIRHDSGDAIEFGEKIIALCKKHDVDPMTKLVVFSDGLNFEKMRELSNYFKGKINYTFGIGTNLTNDCGIIPPNIVIKAVEVDGKSVAKLSDTPGKWTGTDEAVAKYKEIFCAG